VPPDELVGIAERDESVLGRYGNREGNGPQRSL